MLKRAGLDTFEDGATELRCLVGGVARSALTVWVVGHCKAKGDLAWWDQPVAYAK